MRLQIDTETDLGNGLAGPDEPAGGNNENSGPFGTTNQQRNWLINDLASVNRTLTPWLIVSGKSREPDEKHHRLILMMQVIGRGIVQEVSARIVRLHLNPCF